MLGIDEMSSNEIRELLPYIKYAHLDCTHEGKHYVMSTEYYVAELDVYLFTTEGVKTEDIDHNPDVCPQAEEIHDLLYWRKAIINGQASYLTNPVDINQAMHFFAERNPLLLLTINRTWVNAQEHLKPIAIYRVHISDMSGRIIKVGQPFAEQEYS
jgi:uncharacterized protein